jgi:hypothetical protein
MTSVAKIRGGFYRAKKAAIAPTLHTALTPVISNAGTRTLISFRLRHIIPTARPPQSIVAKNGSMNANSGRCELVLA